MTRRHDMKYPHRVRSATCKGRKLEPIPGSWAHWSPVQEGYRSQPTCPACFSVKAFFTGSVGRGNSYSRYATTYICSDCGTKEAFEGFFWRHRCNPVLIKDHHKEKRA